MTRYKRYIGRCPHCRSVLWWDDEANEAMPHNCPMDDERIDHYEERLIRREELDSRMAIEDDGRRD